MVGSYFMVLMTDMEMVVHLNSLLVSIRTINPDGQFTNETHVIKKKRCYHILYSQLSIN